MLSIMANAFPFNVNEKEALIGYETTEISREMNET